MPLNPFTGHFIHPFCQPRALPFPAAPLIRGRHQLPVHTFMRAAGGSGGGNERPAGEPGTLSGAATLGEDQVGSHRAAPPTPAPQFENDAQKGKKK